MVGHPRRVPVLTLLVVLFGLVGCSQEAPRTPERPAPQKPTSEVPASSRALPGIDETVPELMKRADPCGLLDKTALASLGQVTNETGLHFTDCDAKITMSDGRVASLGLQLRLHRADPPLQPLPKDGENGVPVYGAEETNGQCQREIVVAEDTVILLVSSGDGLAGSLCEIVDIAGYALVPMLVRGDVAQVEYAEDSLARRNACELVARVEAGRVPGIDIAELHPAYGGQYCTWGKETVDNPNLFVTFNRAAKPVPAAAGDQSTEIEGHAAVVSPQPRQGTNPPGCRVNVDYRPLDLPSQTRVAEVLGVDVSAEAEDTANCALAMELTGKALRRLG